MRIGENVIVAWRHHVTEKQTVIHPDNGEAITNESFRLTVELNANTTQHNISNVHDQTGNFVSKNTPAKRSRCIIRVGTRTTDENIIYGDLIRVVQVDSLQPFGIG